MIFQLLSIHVHGGTWILLHSVLWHYLLGHRKVRSGHRKVMWPV